MSFEEFGTGFCEDSWSFRARLNENALLDYVARFWGYHAWIAKKGSPEDELLLFLQDNVRVSCFGQVMFQEEGLKFGFSGNITGMHLAAYFGSPVLVMRLWESGMSAESLDFMGRTPLIMAVKQGHYEVIELLVCRAAAHVNAADKKRRTALHWAASTGQKATVELLLAHGAKLHARMNRRHTPLHLAAEEGHLGVVKLLVGAGSEVNALSDTKTTPLYRAARRGHVEVLRALLASGADVNIPTWDGYTALRSATGYGQVGSVEILLSANPDLNIRDERGLTSLDIAKVSGNRSIIRMLEDAATNSRSSNTALVKYLQIRSATPEVSSCHERGATILTSSKGESCKDSSFVHTHDDLSASVHDCPKDNPEENPARTANQQAAPVVPAGWTCRYCGTSNLDVNFPVCCPVCTNSRDYAWEATNNLLR